MIQRQRATIQQQFEIIDQWRDTSRKLEELIRQERREHMGILRPLHEQLRIQGAMIEHLWSYRARDGTIPGEVLEAERRGSTYPSEKTEEE